MDKIEKIRQKIKELREVLEDHNYYLDNSEQALGYGLALDDIGQFLKTLSEEPDKSLEEVAEEYRRTSFKTMMVPNIDGPLNEYCGNVKGSFIAGAKWQREQDNYDVIFYKGMQYYRKQMMEEGIDCIVKEDAGGYPYIERTIELYDYEKDEPKAKKGDKYKLILIKNNGQSD